MCLGRVLGKPKEDWKKYHSYCTEGVWGRQVIKANIFRRALHSQQEQISKKLRFFSKVFEISQSEKWIMESNFVIIPLVKIQPLSVWWKLFIWKAFTGQLDVSPSSSLVQFWLPAGCYQQAEGRDAGAFFSSSVAVASFQTNLHIILYSYCFAVWVDKTSSLFLSRKLRELHLRKQLGCMEISYNDMSTFCTEIDTSKQED